MAVATVGLVLTAAQTLFAAVQCKELRDLCSGVRYKRQLEELQNTVSTIRDVLHGEEATQQELSLEVQNWLGKLKDVVYDVDDLLDEFITNAQLRKQMGGGKISKKVKRFFSRSNQLLYAFHMSKEIEKVREDLDSIAKDRIQFGFSSGYTPVRRKREETDSFVYEPSIVGRDEDKKAIMDLLIQDSGSIVSFVTIVGIGGLGKTTLAQYVYNDEKIMSEFELRLWVCVSEEFDMKEILHKMLVSAKGTSCDDLSMDNVQKKVREEIEKKKYFLVLDDLWSEKRHEWVKLREFLILGGRGSKILVTSRSKGVGRAIGNYPIYELKGLLEDYSLRLFTTIAFEHEQEQDTELVQIGRAIVRKCGNVPLPIRVIAGLLYGQDKGKWEMFRSIALVKIDGITPILKFSYYHLTSPLKSCFSLCALFPKDYAIDKRMLINLWMAHGCLDPCDDKSLEDIGEEYFSIFLQRCFFQDIKMNEYGEISSCKMHDLIHDVAQEVAGIDPSNTNFRNRKFRHLYVTDGSSSLSTPSKDDLMIIRTYMDRSGSKSSAPTILSSCRRLRVLHLHQYCQIQNNASLLSGLLHLRYLDLSGHDLEVLPESITRLHNLQTLKICYCDKLKELPTELRKLVNLRHLDTLGCRSLTYMPEGLDNLTSLHTLSMFVLGETSRRKAPIGQLKDLKALLGLNGALTIKVKFFSKPDKAVDTLGTHVLSKARLKVISIYYESDEESDQGVIHEALLKSLYPINHDLRRLQINGYEGIKMPSWASLENYSVPTFLPSLSTLPNLTFLTLSSMPYLEYVESNGSYFPPSNGTSSIFFPQLKELELKFLPNFKGWWRDHCLSHVNKEAMLPSFPRLDKLTITSCPNLTCLPACPYVKQLEMDKFNEKLTVCRMRGNPSPSAETTATFSTSDVGYNINSGVPVVEELKIDNPQFLNHLSAESVEGPSKLSISHCNLENFSTAEEGFRHCSLFLQDLSITHCDNLTNLFGGGIEHLTNLQTLYLYHCTGLESLSQGGFKYLINLQSLSFSRCDKLKSLSGGGIEHLTNLQNLSIAWNVRLDLEEQAGKEEGMPWRSLQHLSSLSLALLSKLDYFPNGFKYLTALKSLHLSQCYSLRALPEWLPCLTSLRSLVISKPGNYLVSLPDTMGQLTSLITLRLENCSSLSRRCRGPGGEDWPKISHIPDVYLS